MKVLASALEGLKLLCKFQNFIVTLNYLVFLRFLTQRSVEEVRLLSGNTFFGLISGHKPLGV